jgi:(E)-4-hydroxy-3-methylbut-2-enyl-diphosphate synthase
MSLEINRKKTRQICVGNVPIGGGAPIAVQSMTNTLTADVDSTVSQIVRLQDAGCEIVRVAVPDEVSAAAIAAIKQRVAIPVIADIHFSYRLAIAAARSGADALRINPGNIGGKTKIKAVIDCARDHGISIRVGVNSGSIEKEILKKHQAPTAAAMVESAMRHLDMIGSFGFDNIKVSLKASDVGRTIEAYRLFALKSDFPVHVGVTEAGGLFPGLVKSAIGIGTLLAEGIGDTIRVSLTRDPVEEVRAAFEILKALNIRQRGPDIISCPTCGRCNINLFHIVDEVERATINHVAPTKIAIMGCVVNGPGEAREADIGIAGGDGRGVLFKRGEIVKTFSQEKLIDVLLTEIAEYEQRYLERYKPESGKDQNGKKDKNSHNTDPC